MRINPESLAKASSRHPWRTVSIWVAMLVAGIASAATLLGPALTTDFDFTNSPEAKRAQLLLEDRNLTEDVITETFVVAGEPGAIEDPAFAEQVNGFIDRASRSSDPDVFSALPAAFPLTEEQAADPQIAALGPIPSEDGSAVLFTGIYTGDIDEATPHFEDVEAAREAASTDGVEAHMLGAVSSSEDFKVISEEDLAFGESIGVTAAIIVLLIVFGAIVAGLLPLLMTVLFTLPITLGDRRAVGDPLGLQLLHTEPDHDDGHRGRGRLRAVHRVALPRGAAQRSREARCDPGIGRDGLSRRVLQWHDRRARARRHAARADHDLPEPGRRRDHRRAGLGGIVDDAAAGGARRSSAIASTGRTCPASPRSLVFIAMLLGGAVVGGVAWRRGSFRRGSDRWSRGLRRRGHPRQPHGQARSVRPLLAARRAPASVPRAGSGTASPAWSWAARSCGSRSAGRFMIALSMPYWFQGHPDGRGPRHQDRVRGHQHAARRHPDARKPSTSSSSGSRRRAPSRRSTS